MNTEKKPKKIIPLIMAGIAVILLVILMAFKIARHEEYSDKNIRLSVNKLNWESYDCDFSHTSDPAGMRKDINLLALREMINDLASSYPGHYNRKSEFLARLSLYEKMLASVDTLMKNTKVQSEINSISGILREVLSFQREVALSNPLLALSPVLFVVRNQYTSDHHNTETLFHTGEPNITSYTAGGTLKIFSPVKGKSAVLIDAGEHGMLRDPEVHFDSRRIIFSMRKSRDENYSLYELKLNDDFGVVEGSFRRLTSEPEASDIDPLYLPDGKIVFTSTREPKYCHCNMHIMANLHRMDSDGANIHLISKNTLFDGHPSLLPDGRVLYYRWEYVDRNFGDAQGLWTTNPDGTNHAVYWGNNTVSPAAVFDARIIPGTDHVVCIFGSCHDRPWGALTIINQNKGLDSKEAVERIWPETARGLISIDGKDLSHPFMPDVFVPVRSRYEDPFPLTDPHTGKGGKYFLVSRNINYLPEEKVIRASRDMDELVMGIYLVDIFGNEILLHTEKPGCFDPMPIITSPRPQVIPEQRNYKSRTGVFYVANVYEGTHMQGVNTGDVSHLRIIESVEKRFWTIPIWQCAQYVEKMKDGRISTGNTFNRPAVSWAGFETKRILGTVPVEKDGSAYFEVPAEKFIYFHLLDKEGMMVAGMRSGTMVQPGETRGCVGCHENRFSSPNKAYSGSALKRPPDKAKEWNEEGRSFCYMTEVQPVWDKHCVRCHDFGKKAGEKLVLAGDKELVFNASYVELFKNWGYDSALINTAGLGLAPINSAYKVGSHQSRLVKILKNGHQGVELSVEEMEKIITWIDIGGPYYPEYASAHPDNVSGRSPLTIADTRRLEELTGLAFVDRSGNADFRIHKLWVSFDRPEISPCLQKLAKNSSSYLEALAIIKKGQQELSNNPEADMPGFIYCKEHKEREDKYNRLLYREQMRRKAIAEGGKIYDNGL